LGEIKKGGFKSQAAGHSSSFAGRMLLSFSAHKDAAAVHAFAPLAKMLTREQVSFNHSLPKDLLSI